MALPWVSSLLPTLHILNLSAFITREPILKKNKKDLFRERAQAGRGGEGDGEAGSPLSAEPDTGTQSPDPDITT